MFRGFILFFFVHFWHSDCVLKSMYWMIKRFALVERTSFGMCIVKWHQKARVSFLRVCVFMCRYIYICVDENRWGTREITIRKILKFIVIWWWWRWRFCCCCRCNRCFYHLSSLLYPCRVKFFTSPSMWPSLPSSLLLCVCACIYYMYINIHIYTSVCYICVCSTVVSLFCFCLPATP